MKLGDFTDINFIIFFVLIIVLGLLLSLVIMFFVIAHVNENRFYRQINYESTTTRIFVIDVSPEGDSPMVFINPEILETSGEQTGYEGCLSVPGKSGIVTRPNYVKAKATNLDGEEFVVEGEELFARAILHENDHLDGHMYVEKVEGELVNNEDLIAQNEEAQE